VQQKGGDAAFLLFVEKNRYNDGNLRLRKRYMSRVTRAGNIG
jgi:hypothetical protein